jgi:hypothetical protein
MSDSVSRQLRRTGTESRLTANFDAFKSLREERKKRKSVKTKSKLDLNKKNFGEIYDCKGVEVSTGQDLCDCLETRCDGCFFKCRKCKSNKCGLECRQKRKFFYKAIEDQIVCKSRFNILAVDSHEH